MKHCSDKTDSPLCRFALRAARLCCLGLLLFSQSSGDAKADNSAGTSRTSAVAEAKSELVWKSGDLLPGRPIGFSENKLLFESALFREPLEIDTQWLQSFRAIKNNNKPAKSTEAFAIQLIDGQVFLADVISLDEDVLTIQSKRSGQFKVDRTCIASIVNQKTSQTLVAGKVDLDKWGAKRGEKRYWKPNQNGELVATRDEIHLYLESELPESCLIDIELGWEEKLDFALALQIPRGARSLGSVPRLESWDGSIVFSHDDDFEIVLVELDESSKSLKLLIHWDRKNNIVIIHDEMGAELAKASIEELGKKAEPGIFLQNKNGDFRIKSLGIRSAAAGFDPSTTSVQLKSEDAINARIESFDGTTWTAIKDGEPVEIPASEFVGAFQFNPNAEFKQAVGDTLRFQDGEKVSGSIVTIDEGSVTIKTNATREPVTFKSDRLKQLLFDPGSETVSSEKFNHILISDAGKLRGRLESGSPTDENVLFWRVAGATRAIPFANSVMGAENVNAKVILEPKKKSKDESNNEWPDTLFLNNRDLLPVRFRSANENEIVVDSFFENRVIPGSKIRAVEFGSKGTTTQFDFSDSGWLKSGSARLSKEKFKLKKGGTIGHPELLGRGGFEFELDWPSDKYGTLTVQCGRAIGAKGNVKDQKAQSFGIMLYGQQYFVNATADAQNPTNVKQRGGKAIRFKVAVEKDKLVVYAEGKKCFAKKLIDGFGRSVSFKLSDTWGMQVSCVLDDLKLADGFLSGEYIDRERKELVLTIPRLKARNPPAQILCANNFDLARGNIVSVDDEHVMFRTDNSVNRYPREILSSIIWLDTEALIKSLLDSESDQEPPESDSTSKDDIATDTGSQSEDEQGRKSKTEVSALPPESKSQVAQVLMRGGRRVTLTLQRWDEDQLIGQSSLLGNCVIPFEQIFEIRMGKFATEATDIPWSDWVAKLAPKPKLDGDGTGQGDSAIFGSDSPLIGKSPKATLSMLDGKKLELKSLKGRVVVLDFWATWCGPCVKSLPGIKKVIDNYPDSAVTLITVNQNESKTKIESFLESRKLDLKVAMDDGDVSETFKVEAIPQTVIIDAAGKIQFVKVGASKDMEKKLKAAIDSLLDKSDK